MGLFGIIGALQIVNFWLGLYSAPNEWPWTYFFLIVLQLIFASDHYGRSLGSMRFSLRDRAAAGCSADSVARRNGGCSLRRARLLDQYLLIAA